MRVTQILWNIIWQTRSNFGTNWLTWVNRKVAGGWYDLTDLLRTGGSRVEGEDARDIGKEVRSVDLVTFKEAFKDSVGGWVGTAREESKEVVIKRVEDEGWLGAESTSKTKIGVTDESGI